MKPTDFQFADQEVVKLKYAEQLSKFQCAKDHYRRLGVFLLEEAFPNLYFGFTATSLSPLPIIFAVQINFYNYDIVPLSVKFVHPLTFQLMKASQLPSKLLRKLEGSNELQPLLQAHRDDEPFFCIPGVREYHEHPYHSGDSWFLYRNMGNEGSLCFILDNLQLYGTSHIKGYTIQLQLNAQSPGVGVFSDPKSFPV